MPFTEFHQTDIKGLNDNLVAAIAAASGSGPTPLARTFSSGNVSTSGSVASGANSVIFTTDENFVGTINGVTRVASFVYPAFIAGLNNTLPAIAYTLSAGTLTIDAII